MRTILIVEDNNGLRDTLKEKCKRKYGDQSVIIEAGTLAQAFDVFDKNASTLDAITMDGCVDTKSDHADTLPLIQHMRTAGFKGPIIANSSAEKNLELMKAAGASHACSKVDILNKLFEVLPPET